MLQVSDKVYESVYRKHQQRERYCQQPKQILLTAKSLAQDRRSYGTPEALMWVFFERKRTSNLILARRHHETQDSACQNKTTSNGGTRHAPSKSSQPVHSCQKEHQVHDVLHVRAVL